MGEEQKIDTSKFSQTMVEGQITRLPNAKGNLQIAYMGGTAWVTTPLSSGMFSVGKHYYMILRLIPQNQDNGRSCFVPSELLQVFPA